jgi:hypothetical protein
MKIKVNICPAPLCSYFYAWTDNEAEQYIYQDGPYKIKKTNVKFLHNPTRESLITQYEIPQGQDDDFSITLTSSVNFNDFCHVLKTSEFNNPKKYSMRTHNCAHGVMYALKQAGIHLIDIPAYNILIRVDAIGLVRYPFFSTTPFDLYYHLKKHKIAAVRESKELLEFNTQKNNLTFWQVPAGTKQVKTLVTDIVKEVEKKQYAHEEHTKKYADLLMQIYQFITYSPGYLENPLQSEHYKQRKDAHFKKWYLTAILLLSCIDMIARYLNDESVWGMVPPKNPVSYMTACATGFIFFKSMRNPWDHGSELSPTTLSKKLEELDEIVRRNKP